MPKAKIPKVKQLALAGLLLATSIVFSRFLSVQTPILRVSFGFIPAIMKGWLLGPLWGAVIGVASDLLGMLLFPQGTFFPGFTLNAMLTGLNYGFFLHGRPVGKRLFVRLVLALVVSHLVIRLGLNTLWLSIMLKRAFFVVMAGRVMANAITFPIELVTAFFLMRLIEKPVDKYLRNEPFAGDYYGEDVGEDVGENNGKNEGEDNGKGERDGESANGGTSGNPGQPAG